MLCNATCTRYQRDLLLHLAFPLEVDPVHELAERLCDVLEVRQLVVHLSAESRPPLLVVTVSEKAVSFVRETRRSTTECTAHT